ncbi:hypothetical protein [Prosthecobacter fusiformis]|uniref:hypothetical protein n=1 Tax=Prosthecobacter fusiformis TaxID=48464 RepID=UPI00105D6AB4|nr:hypothetical protein [Prosthecobacter fusiformis]
MKFSLLGICDSWNPPYSLVIQFPNKNLNVTAMARNPQMEFDLYNADAKILASCSILEKGSWLRPPSFKLIDYTNSTIEWDFRKKGWFGVSVHTPDLTFICSLAKRHQQIVDINVSIQLKRKQVYIECSNFDFFERNWLSLAGMSYFLWIRYTRLGDG